MVRDFDALLKFIEARAQQPFVWGSAANDCVSYAAAAVLALTGRDTLGDLTWASEDEAFAVLNEVGGLEAAITARLLSISPSMAQRGDVAGVMSGNMLGLTIVEGATLVGPGLRRTHRRPRSDMVAAWRAL
jgi:hypothetical protein